MTNRRWIAGLLAVPAALSAAQSQQPAPPSGAVRLQLRPNAGDTLHLRLDQTIEIGRVSRRGGETPPDVASLVMQARIAVESADAEGASVLAMTDSVRVTATETYGSSSVLQGARAMQGQHVRFRVAPDGSTSLAGGDPWSSGVSGSLFSQLPATLPASAVAPGASWTRTVDIPLAASPDGKATAQLTATFRFDSLSPTGEMAWLTVRGRLVRSGRLAAGASGPGTVETSGEVSGMLLIDRRRGWIAEARTVVTLLSLITTRGKESSPVRARVKITQWMRVL